MKLKRLLVIILCTLPLVLFASCGSFVGSNEFYRKQYITAYKSVSDAIGEVQKNSVSVRRNVKTPDASAFSVKNYQEALNQFQNCATIIKPIKDTENENIPSTVILCLENEYKILRQGSIKLN